MTDNKSDHDKNEELLKQLHTGTIRSKDLENITKDCYRSVEVRRKYYQNKYIEKGDIIERIPFENFDYNHIYGQSCEEVIGYVSIPLGLASPLTVDGKSHCIPMATTEGCLVASTNRGAKTTNMAGGITTIVYKDNMTRSPVLCFDSIVELIKCRDWIETKEGFQALKDIFDKTSRYGSLLSIMPIPSGRYLHLRFSASTGEAMGMNILSKGTNDCMKFLIQRYPTMRLMSISGNTCSDKKPANINWILGRGKSVLAECRISRDIVHQFLHTTPERLQALCMAKNFSGSAMAGVSGGGYNAHAANIVSAVFAATGQDLAQVVESSNCITMFESVPKIDDKKDGLATDLLVTVTMPSLELGTVGGGTRLHHQQACLDLMQLNPDGPSHHLARLLAATVLCAELSLMAALDTNDLVRAHLLLNRRQDPVTDALINKDT